MAEAKRTTIDTGEVAHFAALAAEWWNPNGKFRPLHKFIRCGSPISATRSPRASGETRMRRGPSKDFASST